MNAIPVAADLYWQLPGPKNFITRVAENVAAARVLLVNLPLEVLPGTWDGVKCGIRHAHLSDPIELTIRDGTDVAGDVGVHFGVKRLTAEQLVSQVAPAATAIILRSFGTDGRANCDAYVSDFLKAVDGSSGNIRLVVEGHEPDVIADRSGSSVRATVFDGGLSIDEMEAYVSLRMLDRAGPGSTRLTRCIISEFAGFDVEVAEQIMRLDESQIVNIIDNLHLLMGETPARWKNDSWLWRTRSLALSSATHALNDKYLSEHGPAAGREMALNRLRKRYWRASVKALTHWLEERREAVIGKFSHRLDTISAQNGGQLTKPAGTDRLGNRKVIAIDQSEVEYNNIVGMFYTHQWSGLSLVESDALVVCQKVKSVRDDLAHLRMPDPRQISDLIMAMDRLVP